jgi:hypothetical protein
LFGWTRGEERLRANFVASSVGFALNPVTLSSNMAAEAADQMRVLVKQRLDDFA